ncbi:hypothetical protein E1B28_002397 [Marasmius oreades]|uniref:Uncharacterized protein n=1 Tax=Marasmius oreades TaxID=181124 RepID=A0A9P7RP14_9AGAR|nr:uncharacterized protein E1B28_002397 [Marasmius oreades]KAG7086443.1 hypothetical protein E1B28_002397 [Marasmius oreades]
MHGAPLISLDTCTCILFFPSATIHRCVSTVTDALIRSGFSLFIYGQHVLPLGFTSVVQLPGFLQSINSISFVLYEVLPCSWLRTMAAVLFLSDLWICTI